MTPFGIAVFCDDIRQEVNGKVSLIGCYSDELRFLRPLPETLLKLGISISVRLPIDRATPPLKLRVYLPGDADDAPNLEEEIDSLPAAMNEPFAPTKIDPDMLDGVRWHSLRRDLLLGPIEFQKSGYIRVRLMYGEERIRLGALHVLGPQTEVPPKAGGGSSGAESASPAP